MTTKMNDRLSQLSVADREVLIKAPALISVLAASADRKISDKEEAEAVKFVHLRTFTAHPILLSYYEEVNQNFKKYFEETVNKYFPFDDDKREALKQGINSVNTLIAKLDKRFAQALQKSLSSYAEHVRKSGRGVLENFVFPLPIPGLTD